MKDQEESPHPDERAKAKRREDDLSWRKLVIPRDRTLADAGGLAGQILFGPPKGKDEFKMHAAVCKTCLEEEGGTSLLGSVFGLLKGGAPEPYPQVLRFDGRTAEAEFDNPEYARAFAQKHAGLAWEFSSVELQPDRRSANLFANQSVSTGRHWLSQRTR